ncbi:MAG: thioredoxin family protein [Saprospiraceae bacterium]
MKNIVVLAFLLLGLMVSFAFQSPLPVLTVEKQTTSTVQWMTFEEAMEQAETEPRKFFINIYTDWCSWCKHMEGTTYNDPAIAQFINDNYYAIKLDAEEEEAIQFKNKVYSFVKDGKRGHHELAVEMMRGRWSFPTVVFLDESKEIIQPVNGFKDPSEFEAIITYFAMDYYKKMPWSKYQREYPEQKEVMYKGANK